MTGRQPTPGDIVLHGLPRRIFATASGRRGFGALAALFVVGQLFFVVAPLVPGSGVDNFPWGMFKDASGDNKTVVAWGHTADGTRVDIDLTRWFHYTRGATELRIYDHHPAMNQHKGHHRREQRAFARWLAQRVYVEDGIKLVDVKLRRRRVGLVTGRERLEKIRSVPITEADYVATLPREARVNAP